MRKYILLILLLASSIFLVIPKDNAGAIQGTKKASIYSKSPSLNIVQSRYQILETGIKAVAVDKILSQLLAELLQV